MHLILKDCPSDNLLTYDHHDRVDHHTTVPLVTSSQRLAFWCIRCVCWRSFLPFSGHKSISDRRHVTGFSQPCPGRRCHDPEQLLSLRFISRGNCVLSRILDDVSMFNLLRYRESRAGRGLIHRRSRGVQEPVESVNTECTKPIIVRITPRLVFSACIREAYS